MLVYNKTYIGLYFLKDVDILKWIFQTDIDKSVIYASVI